MSSQRSLLAVGWWAFSWTGDLSSVVRRLAGRPFPSQPLGPCACRPSRRLRHSAWLRLHQAATASAAWRAFREDRSSRSRHFLRLVWSRLPRCTDWGLDGAMLNVAARIFVALASGVIFGFGLSLSGMLDPARVRRFLDIAGQFDPSLAFVLAGAVAVSSAGYLISRRLRHPLLDSMFHLPLKQDIDLALVAGAAIFGVGWSGLCQGPAIASLLVPSCVFTAKGQGQGVVPRRLCFNSRAPARSCDDLARRPLSRNQIEPDS